MKDIFLFKLRGGSCGADNFQFFGKDYRHYMKENIFGPLQMAIPIVVAGLFLFSYLIWVLPFLL